MKTIGKIIFFPITVPLKAYKMTKERIEAGKPYPIEAVVETGYPENYRDYYENIGQKTSMIDGKLIVWKEGTTDKQIKEILEKMEKKLGGVI